MHDYRLLEKGMPLVQASKAIILLHGRGGSAEDIIRLADEFTDETFYVVAPQATNNSWYPYSFLAPAKLNKPWLTSATEVVKKVIDEAATFVGYENVFIMGFSQGACLALETTCRYAAKYAGIVAFSGGLIGETVNQQNYQGFFQETKVFIGNSDNDPHIPLERSEESRRIMESRGASVTLKIYPGMQHTIIRDEINMVKRMMF